jgi:hypothetical protein
VATPVSNEQDAASNVNPNPNWTLDAGASVGDTLIVIEVNDFYTLSHLTTPTGTAVTTWTAGPTGDGGLNHNHFAAFIGTVTNATGTVTTNYSTAPGDEERYGALLRFPSASGVSFDGSAFSGPNTTATSQAAPSVTATSGQTDDMLICVWVTDGGTGTSTYTAPGSMTAGTTRSITPFLSGLCAWEQLASATSGTRTATAGTSHPWCAFSLLVKNAGGGGPSGPAPVIVIPPTAVVRSYSW